MTATNRIENMTAVPLRMSTQLTTDRQTQDISFGARVYNGLNQAGGLVMNTAQIAGSALGLTPIVSAAVNQVANLGGGTASPTVGVGFGGGGGGLGGGAVAGGFGGVSGAAFGTALQAGPPGLVASSVAYSSGPTGLPGTGMGMGLGNGLVATTPVTSGSTSATSSNVLSTPLTTTVGGTGTAGGYQQYFSSLGQEQYRMLNLQIAMQQEYQFFATLSNVLKTRHDTVKAAISNIR